MDGHKHHFVESNSIFCLAGSEGERLVGECHREVENSGLKQ